MLEGDEEGWAETLGDAELADGELEGPVDGSDEGLEEGALLKLGLLEGDEEGWAETLGDAESPDGELEGPVDGSDEGPEEGALLGERLGDAVGSFGHGPQESPKARCGGRSFR